MQKHYYYQCNDCFESDFNGKSDNKIILTQNQSRDWEGVFISPIHPDVNNYLLSVISEISRKYDIDGLNLDYVRYQDSFYGYNSKGLNNFIEMNDFDHV